MDTGFVRKGVGADNRLIRLHRKPRNARDEFRYGNNLRGVDTRRARKHVLARVHGHHDFFERRIAGALTKAIDGAFDLPHAMHYRGKRIGHRDAEIVMTMHRPNSPARIGHPLAQRCDQLAELPRHGIANGIGNVYRGCAGGNHRLQQTAQEVGFRTACILGRELDIVGVLARPLHRLDGLFQDLLRHHAQLHLHVDRRARNEGVHAPGFRALERFAGATDVVLVGTGEAAHSAILDRQRDRFDRLEIAVR